MRGRVLSGVMLAVAGCYSPKPSPGAPCATSGDCPDGLVCAPATNTCERSADGPDAAPDSIADAAPDGAIDAMIDATPPVDAMVDGPACANSFSQLAATCDLPDGPDLSLHTMTIDTGAIDSQMFPVSFLGGPPSAPVRFIVASSLQIAPPEVVTIVGPYPIAFLVDGPVHIDGDLELAEGAGSRATCPLGPQAGMASDGGGSGGGGAAWHGNGGKGGDSDKNGVMRVGGAGGTNVTVDPTRLLAGCTGASGGNGIANGGAGGRGGGAIDIASPQTIVINGSIGVGGGGGRGAPAMADAGGGGGGSGGTIYLEAHQLRVNGSLEANGGGGGGGGTTDDGAAMDGETALIGIVSPNGGMRAGNTAGDGADGSFGGAVDGSAATGMVNSGGGGGGGAAGYIVVRTELPPMLTGHIEPAATTVPYQ